LGSGRIRSQWMVDLRPVTLTTALNRPAAGSGRCLSGRGAAATTVEFAERAVHAAASLRGADVALGVGVLRLGEFAAAAVPGSLASLTKAGSVIHDCPERTPELGNCAHGSDDTAWGPSRPR
jgi:hypothetical protein